MRIHLNSFLLLFLFFLSVSQPTFAAISDQNSNEILKKTELPYAADELLVIFRPVSVSQLNTESSANLTSDHKPGAILSKPGDRLSQSLIVKQLKKRIRNKITQYKVNNRKIYSNLGIEHWKLSKSQNLQKTIQQLKADPDVLVVEPNYRRYPRAISYISSNRAKALSDDILAQIRLKGKRGGAIGLRDIVSATPVASPIVAVIDDAFDIEHEDLKSGRIFQPYNADNSFGIDNNPEPSTCRDSLTGEVVSEDHGTQVMGVLAAGLNNGVGFNGATDENTRIIPIRISCNYTVKAEIDALEWAVESGANIINMSYGAPQFSVIERIAIKSLVDKNILIVTAAGNYEVNNDKIPDYPSGLDLPNIIAVSAVDSTNTLTSWSQYGQTSVDVAAPGDILSIGTTVPSGVNPSAEPYAITGGTSFSAPLVSGVAASLLARYPNLSVYDVKGAMMGSITPLGNNLKARLSTDGVVDAVAAYDLLAAAPKPVIVIKSVKIDDRAGNNNQEVDAGEQVEIVITLENVWGDADYVQMTLWSDDLGISPIIKENFSGIKGFDAATTNRYGTIEQRFIVDFGVRTQSQGLLFKLDISGIYDSGISSTESFQYQRAFSLDTGSLIIGKPIQAALRKHDQDDVHYYHVYVPERKDNIVISLTMAGSETANNLNLLVNEFESPKFEFNTYDSDIEAATNLGVNSGTRVSANGGSQSESITFNNVAAGSLYYIAVVGSKNSNATNIIYSLGVDASDIKLSRGAVSGCTLGGLADRQTLKRTHNGISDTLGGEFSQTANSHLRIIDPILPLLVTVSLIMLFSTRCRTILTSDRPDI